MDDETMSISQVRRRSDVHPEVATLLQQHERRITVLEKADRSQGDKRMEDFKLFTDKLGEVHEKVNKVALGMWALAATGLGFLALQFVLSVAKHTTGGN